MSTTSTWSAEMDRRLRKMRDDPQGYAEEARKAARTGSVRLVGIRKGGTRSRSLRGSKVQRQE